jgi:HK97 family phage prohead protease
MNAREALARRNEGAEPFRHQHTDALQAVTEDERTATFVASDETVDRYGDIVSLDGWDLANFRRNPIFLWMHSQYQPIGKVKKIGVEGDKLLATVKFFDKGDSKTADDLWQLVKKRQLRAVSVGFTVKSDADLEPIRDENERITGWRFLKQELLELSLVSVPANPNALQVARSMGLPQDLIHAALPLDALVREEQLRYRQRLMQLNLAGIKASAPR